MGKPGKKPDPRDEVFIAEYLVDKNVERAAKAAKFADTTARTGAYSWVTDPTAKPHVYEAIRKSIDKKLAKLDITSERILDELARMAFFNASAILPAGQKVCDVDLTKLTVAEASALGEISIDMREKKRALKVKPWEGSLRLAALRILAQYRNLLTPDAAVTVNVNANVTLAERVRRAKERAEKKS